MFLLKSAASATLHRIVQPTTEKAIESIPRFRLRLGTVIFEIHPSRLSLALARPLTWNHLPDAFKTEALEACDFVVSHSLWWSQGRVVHRVVVHERDFLLTRWLVSAESSYSLANTVSLIAFTRHPWLTHLAVLLLPWLLDTYVMTFVLLVASVYSLWWSIPSHFFASSQSTLAEHMERLMWIHMQLAPVPPSKSSGAHEMSDLWQLGVLVVQWNDSCTLHQINEWVNGVVPSPPSPTARL